MKKIISLIICLVIALTVFTACQTEKYSHVYVDGVCTDCGGTDPNYVKPNPPTPPQDSDPVASNKHLLLDADGNYGGTLNRTKYGNGAPLNGQYDVENSEYYTVNDFYNMKSTNERTIYTNFSGYQQTMEYTSGLACTVAALNYWGEDVEEYNEFALLGVYEALNSTTVYGNGTTAQGLANVWQALGYQTQVNAFNGSGPTDVYAWLNPTLSAGKMIFVRGQDNKDNRWKLIIGLDNLGTGTLTRDDILIFADPLDGYDHYQDGYTILNLTRFEKWWQDVATSGVATNKYECLIVTPNHQVTIERVSASEDPTQVAPDYQLPEIHLYRNADGSYGGSRNVSKYGKGVTANGEYDRTNRNYHMYPDVYNMQDTETRLVITNYRAFQQTHQSTCGICAVFSVLAYYGMDTNVYDELYLNNLYEKVTGDVIFNSGVGSAGLKKLATELGFNAISTSYSKASYSDPSDMAFATYEDFISVLVPRLQKDTPWPVCMRPHGGHWEVLIGYDDMGTPEYVYDDVVLLADSYDNWDHYQDGYNVYSATLFFRQWYNGNFTYNQQTVYFENK